MSQEDNLAPKHVGVGISGGHAEVRGDVVGGHKYVTEAPVPAIPALHQLPAPPDDFTGREDELRDLRAAIASGGATISGLTGQGGVGKTVLALKLADEIKGKFPDGTSLSEFAWRERKTVDGQRRDGLCDSSVRAGGETARARTGVGLDLSLSSGRKARASADG